MIISDENHVLLGKLHYSSTLKYYIKTSKEEISVLQMLASTGCCFLSVTRQESSVYLLVNVNNVLIRENYITTICSCLSAMVFQPRLKLILTQKCSGLHKKRVFIFLRVSNHYRSHNFLRILNSSMVNTLIRSQNVYEYIFTFCF